VASGVSLLVARRLRNHGSSSWRPPGCARRQTLCCPAFKHKQDRGLLEAAGIELPVCKTAEQVIEALDFAQHHLDRYTRLRDFLGEATPVTTFAALGHGSDETLPEIEVEPLARQLHGRSLSASPRFWPLWSVAGPGATAGCAALVIPADIGAERARSCALTG